MEHEIPMTFFTQVPAVNDLSESTWFSDEDESDSWRSRERKMKTLNVGLVLCLNIGVDPPDVIKTNPCSKLLCWIDPTSGEASKVEEIGNKMADQYKRWQPKIKCKQALDPTFEDVKKLCSALRRRAKDEPVLFHYNGLGVPRPTQNGELWVFNRSYTQYLPLSVYDLQTWLQSPSVFVYDCNGAGAVIENFLTFVEQRHKENEAEGAAGAASWTSGLEDCIQLAACGADENLPTLPVLPADLFTSCLTTPIEASLRWAYASGRKHLLSRVTPEMIEQAPGQLNDRRTMLGQLNWIFTAITDTIAWNTLPRKVFHKLFRNDLLVAALFRNFLLADRILRSYGCTPKSHPELPETHNHPLWAAWDLASDMCVAQLPDILENDAEFEPSPFFSDQLTAFEVWLSMQPLDGPEEPPEQLPIVLQVLLSQQHRLRALQLLERFLSLGSWAVRRALSVGIFPYAFKLLGSPSTTLRPVLISLWAKILAEDPKVKADLLKSAASPVRSRSAGSGNWKAYNYFVSTVVDVKNEPRLRAMAAFVLAIFADDHPKGQDACIDAGFIESAIPQLKAAVHDPLPEQEALRVWLCMALAKTWVGNAAGRTIALENGAVEALVQLISDPMPRVRAVAVYALGQLIGISDYSRADVIQALANYETYHRMKPGSATITNVANTSQGVVGWAQQSRDPDSAHIIAHTEDKEPSRKPTLLWSIFGQGIGLELLHCLEDGSHAVRLEAAYALTALVAFFHPDFSRIVSKQRPYPAAASEMKKILVSQVLLAGDPVFAVGAPSMFSLKSLKVQPESRNGTKINEHLDQLSRSVPSPKKAQSESLKPAERSPAVAASVKIPAGRTVHDRSMSMDSVGFSVGSLPAPYPSGAFVWHKAGIAVLSDGEAPPVAPSREVVEEIILKISELSARGLYSDDPEMQDALCLLYDQILDASESSSAVETELQRAGWNAADFLHGGLECFTDLAACLQGSTQMSPELRSKTALMPWYRESLDLCDGTVRECVDAVNTREWRHETYTRLCTEATEYARKVDSGDIKLKMDDVTFHTPTKEIANFVQFHPRDPYLMLANKKSGRLVTWRTDKLVETASWSNNAHGSDAEITSVKLINEHDDPLLAVGTSKGLVRLWSGWADENTDGPTLCTGWRAVHKLKDNQGKGAGLVLGWNQSRGRLYAGGDVSYVQVWDANTESRCQKIDTTVAACLTSLCVLPDSNGLLGMGFGNGHVILCDPRLPPDQCLVQHYEQHKSWVVNVHLQRLNRNHIISGSEAGDILWWDPRFPGQAVRNLVAYQMKGSGDKLSSMVVHDFHSLIATATPHQFTKIFNLEGELLDHYKGKVNFVGEPFGSTSCLGFHQFEALLAFGSREKIVTVCRAESRGGVL